jgi:hypothetical protein
MSRKRVYVAPFLEARNYDTDNRQAMETHLFYLDEDSILREHVFRDDDETGFSGSLSAQNITPAPDTQLASYWPLLAYQNSDKTFSEMQYNCTKTAINCWNSENLKIAGDGPSAALAMVPTERNMNGTFLFYQREDGELVHSKWENETNAWGSCTSPVFPPQTPTNSAPLDGDPIPFESSREISVFAMPQGPDSKFLNFHALYQETDDPDISWLWKEGGKWHTVAKPDPLKGAMQGTSIACLTQESWWNKRLTHDYDINRCYYFGGGGRLRSVHRVNATWVDLGRVEGVGGM